jgi:hypothetical protein
VVCSARASDRRESRERRHWRGTNQKASNQQESDQRI